MIQAFRIKVGGKFTTFFADSFELFKYDLIRAKYERPIERVGFI
jgi:hypothetical protein